MNPVIIPYENKQHRKQVITLWHEVFGYASAHNDPAVIIDTKIHFDDSLFFVALDGQTVIGTIMAGYDGHRGWIYSIAVSPLYRNRRIGTSLLTFAEQRLSALGCMKINLQIMECNDEVVQFYKKCGYEIEQRISMGKKLIHNIPEKS